mgnify:CR=1 FL=1
MKITTVKGTNDYLPEEVRLRDYLQNQILNTYQDAGFERIMTPAVEDIENLDIMQIIVNNLFFLQSVYRLIRCTERKDRKRADFVSLCSAILI